LNLFRPKQIANDIWRGSDPSAPAEQSVEWQERSVPALFQWWWGLYIFVGFSYNAAVRIDWNATTAASHQTAAGAGMFADSLSVIGAILALFVVRSATIRQEERAARMVAAPVVPETA
jgi:hypothetical protein